MAQDVGQLSHAIAGATNNAFSESRLAGQIEKLRPAPNAEACYTKEQTNCIISIYAAGFDPALAAYGIIDYGPEYAAHCRRLICCLFEKFLAGVLWWFTSPSSIGLPEAQR